MNYKTKQGAIISDDGYTKVIKQHNLSYGWEATLWNNDRLVITHDATGETLSIPPESTQKLRDIFKSIITEENKPSKLQTYLFDNHKDNLTLKEMSNIIKLAEETDNG